MLSKTNILSLGLIRRLLLAVALVLCATGVFAQQNKPQQLAREHINVFWLMNFYKYVEWPNDTANDLIVGVFGNASSEYHRLKGMQTSGATFNGRKFKTIRFPNVSKIEYSHILYVNRHDLQYLADINEKIKGQPTLLVTDSCSSDLSDLFMVNLVLQSRTNQFQVNINKATEAGLKISQRAVVEGGSRVDVETINREMENQLLEKEKELQDKEWELDQKKEEIYQMSMSNDFQEEENSRKQQQIEEAKNEIQSQSKIADSLMRAKDFSLSLPEIKLRSKCSSANKLIKNNCTNNHCSNLMMFKIRCVSVRAVSKIKRKYLPISKNNLLKTKRSSIL